VVDRRKSRWLVLTRRELLGSLAVGVTFAAARSVASDGALGRVVSVEGTLTRNSVAPAQNLAAGASLMENDYVVTADKSFATLDLGSDTQIRLGPETHLLIDHYLADQGGKLELVSGQMVFDRPEGKPKIDVSLHTAFGMIGVRGTKFFAGPLNGVFSVFVEHGKVEVSNAGVSRKVLGGQGIEIRPPAGSVRSLGPKSDLKDMGALALPTLPQAWAKDKIREAYASVGIK
jgi:hypothetical protein